MSTNTDFNETILISGERKRSNPFRTKSKLLIQIEAPKKPKKEFKGDCFQSPILNQSSLRVQAFRVWMFPKTKTESSNWSAAWILSSSNNNNTRSPKKQNTRLWTIQSWKKEEHQKFQPLDWCGVSSLHSALVYPHAYVYSQVFLSRPLSTWFCNLSLKKESRAFKESGQTFGLTTTTTATAGLINKRM